MADVFTTRGKAVMGALAILNLVLAVMLVSGLRARTAASISPEAVVADEAPAPPTSEAPSAVVRPVVAPTNREPQTVFSAVYSANPKQFAANLRSIQCPEETVKDIIIAELARNYRAREDALRPKPADHVPFTWSANTSEGKLVQRRQQAAALAREKAATLRDILGYDVPVPLPLYAQTSSDQHFEEGLAQLPPESRAAVSRAREQYWADVEIVRTRTKGFWEPDDIAELERLKQQHRETLLPYLNGLPKEVVSNFFATK